MLICDLCGQGVGPDCCRSYENQIRGYCHFCFVPRPEHNDVQPEHNGLQPEHNGLQPGHNVLQPEHNGLEPEHNVLQSDQKDLSLQNGETVVIHCDQSHHRGPCLLPHLITDPDPFAGTNPWDGNNEWDGGCEGVADMGSVTI